MIEYLPGDLVRLTGATSTQTFTLAEFQANQAACISAVGGLVEPVPYFVTRGQFKIRLEEVGQLENIKTILANPATPVTVTAAFDDEAYIFRDSPGLEALRVLAGFTATQLDNFFRTAAKIKV